jgi:hypothetical protein
VLTVPGREKSAQFSLADVFPPEPVVELVDEDKNELIRDAIGFHVTSPLGDKAGIHPSVAMDGGWLINCFQDSPASVEY